MNELGLYLLVLDKFLNTAIYVIVNNIAFIQGTSEVFLN